MDANEYKHILAEDGRRVANRAAYAAFRNAAEHSLNDFYQMYDSEERLPESERCKTGMIDRFDPCNWSGHYLNHPANTLSPVYHATRGASARWLDQLVGACKFWGDWVIKFLYYSMVHDVSNDLFDRIADDKGEFNDGNGCAVCFWFPGWFGWSAWVNSLSDEDISALQLVLRWCVGELLVCRHPDPGSPEAEAFLARHVSQTKQGVSNGHSVETSEEE
ncbi:hypothetical protein [Burkholderia sp. WSM2230]|uniref:hypothetical protein n=1 Tax=Burkholderia sp. WSM2230 TaxID=944435 RepID=UPI0003FBBB9D|nr:hypothetical protein [Burkholderia sp. WSM2230]